MKKLLFILPLSFAFAGNNFIDQLNMSRVIKDADLQCINIFYDNGVKKYTIDQGKIDGLQKRVEQEHHKYIEKISKNSEDFLESLHSPLIDIEDLKNLGENAGEIFHDKQFEYRRKILHACRGMMLGFMFEHVTKKALENLHDPKPKLWQDDYWLYDSEINSVLLYVELIRNITLPSEIDAFKRAMQELDFATLVNFYNKIKSDDDMVVIPD